MVERLVQKAMMPDRVRSYHFVRKDLFTQDAIRNLKLRIAPRFLDEGRKSGFTRISRAGNRHPDAAEMATIELVGNDVERWEKEQEKKAKEELGKPSYWEWELKLLRQE